MELSGEFRERSLGVSLRGLTGEFQTIDGLLPIFLRRIHCVPVMSNMHRPGKAASLAPQANVDRFFEGARRFSYCRLLAFAPKSPRADALGGSRHARAAPGQNRTSGRPPSGLGTRSYGRPLPLPEQAGRVVDHPNAKRPSRPQKKTPAPEGPGSPIAGWVRGNGAGGTTRRTRSTPNGPWRFPASAKFFLESATPRDAAPRPRPGFP
jgi:hypothetical protein